MSVRTPSYRYHKARGCAVVTIAGKDHYLGEYDSPASWEQYHRLVAEWFAAGRNPPPLAEPEAAPLTVSQLILRYWRFVRDYYVKGGEPTSEQDTIRQALRFLRRLYGSTPARDFSPKSLKAVRQAMIVHKVTRKVKVRNEETGEVREVVRIERHGLSRRFINKQLSRIKRMFGWAVEEELVPVEVHAALLRVRGLKKGKGGAREKPRVRPVKEEHVEAVLPLVPVTVRAMIEVERLCGGRPQDVVQMRTADIDRTGTVWEFRPRRFKTEHHDDEASPDRERVVFLGPRAQEILKPFFTQNPEDFLFSPRRSEERRLAEQRRRRTTPLWPSHVLHQQRKRSARQRAPLRDHYDVASYRRAIRRACLRAGIPVWHPNQLRHSRLTEIRRQFGLEASKACAGHREIGVTQHYAEKDRELARHVMMEIG
jgi:integrase